MKSLEDLDLKKIINFPFVLRDNHEEFFKMDLSSYDCDDCTGLEFVCAIEDFIVCSSKVRISFGGCFPHERVQYKWNDGYVLLKPVEWKERGEGMIDWEVCSSSTLFSLIVLDALSNVADSLP